jgi:hypothetical protein
MDLGSLLDLKDTTEIIIFYKEKIGTKQMIKDILCQHQG